MIPIHRIPRRGFGSISIGFVLAACLSLAVGGCGDDEDDPMGPEEPLPLRQDTPQSALSALVYAYTTRDSVRTKALYDSSYTGTSTDLNDPGTTLDFTYDDEVRHVAALARSPGLTAIMDLGPQVTWERLGSDDPSHPEWAIIQISGSAYLIQVYDDTVNYGVRGEAGTYQQFAFAPHPDSTSQTDTLWQIVRWREVGAGGP